MKIVLLVILAIILNTARTFAQSLVNGDFTLFTSPNCISNNEYGCSTFSSSCVTNWFRTHGRPQVINDIYPSSNYRLKMTSSATTVQSVGEGRLPDTIL